MSSVVTTAKTDSTEGDEEEQAVSVGEDVGTVKSWRARIDRSIAKSRKIRGGNYVQLSTVDSVTSEPRCRTVVFRGFLPHASEDESRVDRSCTMKMITDARSAKVTEMQESEGIAEIVWWFAKSSEQYRIRGTLQFVGADDGNDASDYRKFLSNARKQQWGNLREGAQESFYGNDPQREYQPPPVFDEEGKAQRSGPPDTFLLMLLHPFRVDYVHLAEENYRQVDEYDSKTASWTSKRMNP